MPSTRKASGGDRAKKKQKTAVSANTDGGGTKHTTECATERATPTEPLSPSLFQDLGPTEEQMAAELERDMDASEASDDAEASEAAEQEVVSAEDENDEAEATDAAEQTAESVEQEVVAAEDENGEAEASEATDAVEQEVVAAEDEDSALEVARVALKDVMKGLSVSPRVRISRSPDCDDYKTFFEAAAAKSVEAASALREKLAELQSDMQKAKAENTRLECLYDELRQKKESMENENAELVAANDGLKVELEDKDDVDELVSRAYDEVHDKLKMDPVDTHALVDAATRVEMEALRSKLVASEAEATTAKRSSAYFEGALKFAEAKLRDRSGFKTFAAEFFLARGIEEGKYNSSITSFIECGCVDATKEPALRALSQVLICMRQFYDMPIKFDTQIRAPVVGVQENGTREWYVLLPPQKEIKVGITQEIPGIQKLVDIITHTMRQKIAAYYNNEKNIVLEEWHDANAGPSDETVTHKFLKKVLGQCETFVYDFAKNGGHLVIDAIKRIIMEDASFHTQCTLLTVEEYYLFNDNKLVKLHKKLDGDMNLSFDRRDYNGEYYPKMLRVNAPSTVFDMANGDESFLLKPFKGQTYGYHVNELHRVFRKGYCDDKEAGDRFMNFHLGRQICMILSSRWGHSSKSMTLETGVSDIGKDMVIESTRSVAPGLLRSLPENVFMRASKSEANGKDYESLHHLTYASIVYASDPEFKKIGDAYIRGDIANNCSGTYRPPHCNFDVQKPVLGQLVVSVNDSALGLRPYDLHAKIDVIPDVYVNPNGEITDRLRAQFVSNKDKCGNTDNVRQLLSADHPDQLYICDTKPPEGYVYQMTEAFVVVALSCLREDMARHEKDTKEIDFNPHKAMLPELRDQCRLRLGKFPQPSDLLRGIAGSKEQQRGCVYFSPPLVTMPDIYDSAGTPVPASALRSPATARKWLAAYVRKSIVDSPSEGPGVYMEDVMIFLKTAFSGDESKNLLNMAAGFDKEGEPLPMLVFGQGGGGFKDILQKHLLPLLTTAEGIPVQPNKKPGVRATGAMTRFYNPDGGSEPKNNQRTLTTFPFFRWDTNSDPTRGFSEEGIEGEAASSEADKKKKK